MVREIQHVIEQMTDDERRQYLSESLFLNIVSYENERLGAYMKKLTERNSRVPELPGDPVHLFLAVEHDGAPLRRTAGLRLRRSVRQARARRHADVDGVSAIWTGETRRRRCAATSNAGGSKFCGDCPLKLPLKKDERAAACASGRRPAAVAPLHRVHGRLQHLVRPGLLRAGDRHHAHAPGRHARLRAVHAASSTRPGRRSAASTSSTTARPSSTSARSRCASTSSRAFRTSTSTPARTASRFTEEQVAAARALGHRRGHVLDRRRDGGELRAVPAARRLRQGDPQPDGPRRTKSAAPGATCRSSTGATSSSRTTTATRRWRWRAAWRPRSASIASAGSSPTIRRTCSRAGSCRGAPGSPRSSTRSGTRTTSATRSPAPRRAREIDVGGPLPAPAARRQGRAAARPITHDVTQPVDPPVPGAGQLRTPPGPRSARSSAPATASLINRDYERAWLPAHLQPARACRRADHGDGARHAGTLRAEVRSGQRGDRLVRGVRIGNDDEDAGRDLEPVSRPPGRP